MYILHMKVDIYTEYREYKTFVEKSRIWKYESMKYLSPRCTKTFYLQC